MREDIDTLDGGYQVSSDMPIAQATTRAEISQAISLKRIADGVDKLLVMLTPARAPSNHLPANATEMARAAAAGIDDMIRAASPTRQAERAHNVNAPSQRKRPS